jgi:ketosteroid isomerase-like protein
MKRLVVVVAIVLFVSIFGLPQQGKPQGSASAKSAPAPALQAKIEQAWKDWVKKDEKAVGNMLADDAVEIWADGKGPHDKKSTLDGMKSMNIEKYALSDFKVTPLAATAQLAQYRADVQFKGAPQPYKLVVTEVWQKRGAEWKLVHYQETEVK